MKKLISSSNLLLTRLFLFVAYVMPTAAFAQLGKVKGSVGAGANVRLPIGSSSSGGGGGNFGVGAGDKGGQIGEILCTIVGWFTGSIGQGLATLAVIVIGVGALMGKVSWGMAIIVAVGIAAIFGAPQIVSSLGGNAGGCLAN